MQRHGPKISSCQPHLAGGKSRAPPAIPALGFQLPVLKILSTVFFLELVCYGELLNIHQQPNRALTGVRSNQLNGPSESWEGDSVGER